MTDLEARWAKRWLASFLAAVALLAVAGGLSRLISALAACGLLGVTTVITHAVMLASEQPLQARKRSALQALRWSATALAVLALLRTSGLGSRPFSRVGRRARDGSRPHHGRAVHATVEFLGSWPCNSTLASST